MDLTHLKLLFEKYQRRIHNCWEQFNDMSISTSDLTPTRSEQEYFFSTSGFEDRDYCEHFLYVCEFGLALCKQAEIVREENARALRMPEIFFNHKEGAIYILAWVQAILRQFNMLSQEDLQNDNGSFPSLGFPS